MSQLPNVASTQPGSAQSTTSSLNDVDLDDFLKLMLAELQNQDPLNPLENDQLIEQISQIRSVGATEKLSETLDAVLLGQNISSATNLIGAHVDAISDDNQSVTGVVNRVSVSNGQPKLHLDERSDVRVSEEPGDLAAGKYNYRIVWQGEDGVLLGVETEKPIEVADDGKSIAISNLPLTDTPKQIFRTKAGGEGPFHLVATLPNGAMSTYLDTSNDAALPPDVLTTTPQFISTPNRSFTVSLKNVGEIRPPGS